VPLLCLLNYTYIPVQLKEGETCGGKADNFAHCGSSPQSMKKKPELVLERRVGS
jgi:hypothetical protein